MAHGIGDTIGRTSVNARGTGLELRAQLGEAAGDGDTCENEMAGNGEGGAGGVAGGCR